VEGNRTDWVKPDTLLCTETLQKLLPRPPGHQLENREGLKELIAPLSRSIPLTNKKAGPKPSHDPSESEGPSEAFALWERCFEVILEEAASRCGEMLRLNRARRLQIEKRLESLGGPQALGLEAAIQSRVGTPEHHSLQRFVNELALFHLFQFLLWRRLGGEAKDQENTNLPFSLQKLIRHGKNAASPLSSHDPRFLKQNLFSWFHLSQQTLDRLALFLRQLPPTIIDASLLHSIAQHLIQKISPSEKPVDLHFARFLWQLIASRSDSGPIRLPARGSARIAHSEHGGIVLAAKSSGIEPLVASFSFGVRNELELYITEMLLQLEKELPPAAHDLEVEKLEPKGPVLFPRSQLKNSATSLALFIEANKGEFGEMISCLNSLSDGGMLLAACQTYWPAEASPSAEKVRDAILRTGLVCEIIDLRQLAGWPPATSPKCLFLIQRSNSREIRDSQRPRIVRFRGQISSEETAKIYNSILESRAVASATGELKSEPVAGLANVKQELLEAAATQQQLRAHPWISLTDPAFFEATALLRRSPTKAHLCGTVMRNLGKSRPEKSIVLIEEASSLTAYTGTASSEEGGFLFLPDSNCREHPLFFKSQFLATPAQFFYRIGKEEPSAKPKGAQGRHTEQLLKMVPMVRILPSGLSVVNQKEMSWTREDLRTGLPEVMANFVGNGDRAALYQWCLNAEAAAESLIAEANELVNHLHPGTDFKRFFLPEKILSPSPRLVLQLFQHLDQSPLLQHPLIHVTRLKPVADFRITDFQIDANSPAGVSEVKILQGSEVVVRLTGPTLYLQAATEQIKLGRTFREWSDRIRLPTDLKLLNSQVSAVIECSEQKLKLAQGILEGLDLVFSFLLGLSRSWQDDTALKAMKKFLGPAGLASPLPVQSRFSPESKAVQTKGLLQ
jgi:hypothetical protein